MQRWEYCVFTAVESANHKNYTLSYDDNKAETVQANGRLAVIADLGRDSWELVAINPLAPGINEFYFKRPLR